MSILLNRGLRVVTGAVQLMLAALLLSSCSPCDATSSCAAGPYLSATGQIVDPSNGAGIDGVRIDVIRTGGIATARDSVATVTAGGGFWRAELEPAGEGEVVADIKVAAACCAPYRLRSVRLHTRPNRGDANLNERWVPSLYFYYVGEFFIEGTADERAAGRRVEFRRTGGVPLVGPGLTGSSYVATTDGTGRVILFPSGSGDGVFASEEGDVIGDLIVTAPGGAPFTALRGITLAPRHGYRDRQDFPPVYRAPVPR